MKFETVDVLELEEPFQIIITRADLDVSRVVTAGQPAAVLHYPVERVPDGRLAGAHTLKQEVFFIICECTNTSTVNAYIFFALLNFNAFSPK